MITITQAEFDRIPDDYKNTYIDYDGQHPEWLGWRTAFLLDHRTMPFIEDVSFRIVSGSISSKK